MSRVGSTLANHSARRDTAVNALLSAMARGRRKVKVGPGRGGAVGKLSEREKTLRVAWLRGQINARHGWKRRPPRSWLLGIAGDLERNRFFYAGYDAMSRQRRTGRGVTLMPVPDAQWVSSLHLLRPASDRPQATMLGR